ncbi:MAG TPA: hypothetical protein VMP10_01130 [Chloroflexota bacterium]|nr:hypothetical protein [Chloroflexota bacterium]
MNVDDSRHEAQPIAGLSLNAVLAGAVAGVLAGVVFGMLMTMMGMMPMIASLVGSQSVAVGWIVHLIISAIIGGIYGLLLGSVGRRVSTGWWVGALYGVVWWVLGPLLIMPTMMGMGPQFGMAFAEGNLMSLMGHVIFGVILGVAYPPIRVRFA